MSSKNGDRPATRAELDGAVERLSVAIIKTNGRIDTLERNLGAKIEAGNARILSVLDGIAGKQKDHDRTVVVFDRILKDHRERLDGHEKRLKSVESRE